MSEAIIFFSGFVVGALAVLMWVAWFVVPIIEELRERLISIRADFLHEPAQNRRADKEEG